MTPKDYWNMCYRHLSDTTFYNNLDNNDPSTIVQDRVNKFAEKYKSILTNNEYNFLTSHKKRTEYIQIDENILVEGRLIVEYVEYPKFYIVLWNLLYL